MAAAKQARGSTGDTRLNKTKRRNLTYVSGHTEPQAMTIQVIHAVIREVQRDKEAVGRAPTPQCLGFSPRTPSFYATLSEELDRLFVGPWRDPWCFKSTRPTAHRQPGTVRAEQTQRKAKTEGNEGGMWGGEFRAWLSRSWRMGSREGRRRGSDSDLVSLTQMLLEVER